MTNITPLGQRLGSFVRDERTRREWTQEDLARRVGVTRERIAQIEAGGWGRPDTIQAIADAFEAPVVALLAAETERELLAAAIVRLPPAEFARLVDLLRSARFDIPARAANE